MEQGSRADAPSIHKGNINILWR